MVKVVPIMAALLVLTILASPVHATGAHLWFYSVDPSTLPDWTGKIDGAVNPQDDDPNYVGVTSDAWTTESVVIASGEWETPFNLWIGNADPKDGCHDTTLVISVNDAAAAAIAGITVTPGGNVGAWDTTVANFPLPPHGISNSAEYYGFAEVIVGDIASGSYMQVTIDITLNVGADLEEAKIHFDAYGWSDDAHNGDYDIFSPFSHDSTFVIPEVATIFLTASSMLAFGAYIYRKKKE
jgi:hypothetical protein